MTTLHKTTFCVSSFWAKCDTDILIFNLHDRKWLHLAHKGLDIRVFFPLLFKSHQSWLHARCVFWPGEVCSGFQADTEMVWSSLRAACQWWQPIALLWPPNTQQHNGIISWIDLQWYTHTHTHRHNVAVWKPQNVNFSFSFSSVFTSCHFRLMKAFQKTLDLFYNLHFRYQNFIHCDITVDFFLTSDSTPIACLSVLGDPWIPHLL